MLDVTETVYRTMAEDARALDDVGKEALGVFTEPFSLLLPAIADERRLARFRTLAQAVLAAPEEGQPESVRANRPKVERALAVWSPPLSVDEAASRLRAGTLTPAEAQRVLARLPPGDLARLDPVALVGPLLRAGDWRAVQALARIRSQLGEKPAESR